MFFSLNGELSTNDGKVFSLTLRDGDPAEMIAEVRGAKLVVVGVDEVDAGDEDCSKSFTIVRFVVDANAGKRGKFAAARKEWIRWTKGSANDFELECRRKLMVGGIVDPTPNQWVTVAELLVSEIHEVLSTPR
jgi:hypothetical protein